MKKGLKKIGKLLLKVMLWFIAITFCWVLLYRWVNPPITFLMVSRYIECEENCSIEKQWVDYEDISEHMVLGVVVCEDQNFFKHNGLDFGAIEKAVKQNKKGGRKRGASTISQQTAKNAFLYPSRSWVRKGLEVYFTFLIELLWNKERILEVYLNIIEMGDGIYGVGAASQKYFKKPAAQLSKSQAALISVTLPNPRKFSAARPSSYLIGRQQWCMNQMRLFGGTGYLHKWLDEEEESE